MAGQDTTEVRAGISGSFLSAPVGSDAPEDTSSSWDADWTDHGILSEDGPGVQPSMDKADFKGWQKTFPVRTTVTDRGMEYTVTLIQKNGQNLKLAFGGGEITDLGGGDYLYEPPQAQEIDYRMFGLEVLDGDIIDRYICERGIVSNIAAIPFKKDEPVKFDLTISVSSAPGQEDLPWHLISNDPAMADGIVS